MPTTPYATPADFRKHFGELETAQVSDLNNEGAENLQALTLALRDASEEVDSYLAGKYALPLPAGAILGPLTRAACDVARYRLYKDRPTDEVTVRYKQTVAYLKDLASGTARIVFDPPLDAKADAAAQTPAVAYGTYGGGVFSSDVFAKQPGFRCG